MGEGRGVGFELARKRGHVKKSTLKIKQIYGFKIAEIFFLKLVCYEMFAKQKKETKAQALQLIFMCVYIHTYVCVCVCVCVYVYTYI